MAEQTLAKNWPQIRIEPIAAVLVKKHAKLNSRSAPRELSRAVLEHYEKLEKAVLSRPARGYR
jgi:hypothetical protein